MKKLPLLLLILPLTIQFACNKNDKEHERSIAGTSWIGVKSYPYYRDGDSLVITQIQSLVFYDDGRGEESWEAEIGGNTINISRASFFYRQSKRYIEVDFFEGVKTKTKYGMYRSDINSLTLDDEEYILK